jgi:hypothetical protein
MLEEMMYTQKESSWHVVDSTTKVEASRKEEVAALVPAWSVWCANAAESGHIQCLLRSPNNRVMSQHNSH